MAVKVIHAGLPDITLTATLDPCCHLFVCFADIRAQEASVCGTWIRVVWFLSSL